MQLSELIPVLTIAIGPVILISGVGLLLLSMTNRLGRTIDRSRSLIVTRYHEHEDDRKAHEAQLEILWRRALLLRTAITLAAIAALLAAILIIMLFVGVILKLEIALVVIALFVGCLVAVIISLVYFICDIEMSLRALAMELHRPEAKRD
jgi:hypothetical protein